MNTLERPSTNGHASGRVETIILDHKRWPNRPWRAIAAGILIIALIVTGVLIYRARANGSVAYVTSPVARQDLVQTVSATGTVNPQNTIDVGTQVSGTISEVDVDYNSKVHKGQVLARLDPTELQQALASAQASLAQSRATAAAAQESAAGAAAGIDTAGATAAADAANAKAAQATALSNQQAIAGADASVTKDQSALQLAQTTLNRDNALLAQGYIAQAQADADKSALVAAQTTLTAAQAAAQQSRSVAAASVAQAQASAEQAVSQTAAITAARTAAAGGADTAQANGDAIEIQEENVQQAQTNLAHSVITSPVDGTVIARDVSVGTTVAASLQTPTLFAIAQNIDKMEVDLAVGEPDIGSVKNGEAVTFTVLAYPNRTFQGVVSQVRIDPTTVSNVVTYTAVVLVNNNDNALLPGMTANATIGVQKAQNALVVPLAALSFTPEFSGTHRTAAAKTNGASPWGQTTGSASAAIVAGSQSRVFVERNGKLTRIPVTVTLVSGTQAAVAPAGDATLAIGDQVVTGGGAAVTHAQRSGANANPLAGGGGPGGAMRGIH